MTNKFDFSGYATKNDLRCADGRTIRKDAFKENDGQIVPLVWQHLHNDPANILGHALLENRDDGVYAYCTFNDTEAGKNARELVKHGDISRLSIYANQLRQKGGDVLHGLIREVSLVLAGANPGAMIDYLDLEHSDDEDWDGEAVIYSGEDFAISHAEEQEHNEEPKEEKKMASEKTVKDIWDSLTEEQKNVVYYMIGQAIEDGGADDKEEDENVKHNVFENDERRGNYLTHDDMKAIFDNGRRLGSLREGFRDAVESGTLAHAIDTTDMEVSTGNQEYFVNDPSFLFPEARSLNNPPEWIKRNTDWVAKVMGATHHTPFSRIKSVYANITEDEARAKGYYKTRQKKEEVFSLLKRATTPQTIYKKQKIDRDDMLDITDFDVVAWIRSEMRMMLNEEIARAILIGDGRLPSDDDKISPDHIRPIVSDAPLFTIQATVASGATDEETAKNFIKQAIKARKNYKGSGNPTLFTTEDMLTNMLLIEDLNQRFIYTSEAQLATALRVKEIVTVPVLENFTNASGNLVYGIIVNLADYNVGADKGGEVNMFDDFDIDYNQQKYLIETRCSGALIKPYSAIVLSAASANAGNQEVDDGE